MFHPLDLVAPIGLSLVAFALCLWGAFKAQAFKAKVVCVVTGVVFLAAIPTWYVVRSNVTTPDYTTADGLGVVKGKINDCPKDQIERWSDWVIAFWSKHYDPAIVRGALNGKLLVCVDEEELSVWGRAVRGYTHGRFSVIGWNGDQPYTESLFYHETSHAVLGVFVPFDEALHHAKFKALGLGH